MKTLDVAERRGLFSASEKHAKSRKKNSSWQRKNCTCSRPIIVTTVNQISPRTDRQGMGYRRHFGHVILILLSVDEKIMQFL